jgi:heme/copper-type cytochrome/quinol oxidase subunit 3
MENNPTTTYDRSTDKKVTDSSKIMIMAFIIFSVTMLFGGLVSAYLVSSIGQYWVHLTPPTALWVSNALIVASSVSLFASLKAMKGGNVMRSKMLLIVTLALGIGFTVAQYSGWKSLAQIGSGFGTETNDDGLAAYSWNRINELIESEAVYGEDYDVRINGTPILFNADSVAFYAPNDALMVRPITSEVVHRTNSSASYIWALILIHIFHLVLGIAYLSVNLFRVSKGTINPEDTVRLKVLSIFWHFLGGLWLVLFLLLFIK